jgi:hypothetical protein
MPEWLQAFRGVAHRVGWGIGDQALSSLTNMAVSVFVARNVGTAEFGAFSLVFATYLVALGASRAIATEPLAVRFSHSRPNVWRSGTALASGAAVFVGVCLGLLCVLLGLLLGGRWSGPYVALGVTLPGLLLQDSYRFAFVAAGRGGKSFLNDLAWALVVAPLFVAVPHTVPGFVLAWGGAATVAAIVGIVQSGVLPTPLRVSDWWRDHRDLASHFLGMFAARSGSLQLSTYAVALFGGLAAAGTLRAGQVLLGPLTVLFLGMRLIGVAEGVRLLRGSPEKLRLGAGIASVTLGASACVWGALIFLLPGPIGSQLMGASWEPARGVVLPLSIAMAASGLQTGAVIGIRSMSAVGRGLRSQVIEGLITLLGGAGGALLAGARGAAWGLAVAYVLEAAMWWWQFHKAIAEYPTKRGEPVSDDRSITVQEAEVQLA